MSQKAIAVTSGGLDSTTLVYDLLAQDYEVDCLSFDYGQRHKKELVFAAATAKQLGLRHDIVDLTGLTHLISNSALTSNPMNPTDNNFEMIQHIEVPEGHYAEGTMKRTVVPNRNMIMLSIAAGVAVNRQANTIATGVHAGDHFVYPDCRPAFIYACGQTILVGNEGFHNFNLEKEVELQGKTYNAAMPITTPYLNRTKADIAYRALELNVPFHLTWSCYKGEENHCGRCGTCVERLEAIHEAFVRYVREYGEPTNDQGDPKNPDQTVYDDIEFWKIATRGTVK